LEDELGVAVQDVARRRRVLVRLDRAQTLALAVEARLHVAHVERATGRVARVELLLEERLCTLDGVLVWLEERLAQRFGLGVELRLLS